MNKRWSFFSATVFLVIALLSFVISGCENKPAKSPTVNIAVNLPLTGPQAAFSGEFPLGLKMGINEGAAAQGIDPAVFKLDLQDNQGSTKNTLSVFQNQKIDGFDAYISGLTTSSLAIAPELDKMDASHLLLAFGATITSKGPNRFRTIPSYKTEGPKYAEYVKLKKAKRVFMFSLNLAPTEYEFTHYIEPELTKMGVKFKRERFEISTTDYRTLALKALEFKPDLILISGLSFNILPLVQGLASLDYIKDGNILCSMDLIDLLYEKTIPAELNGVAYISPLFEIPGAVPGADAWRDRFRKLGGKVPNYVQAYAYDTGRIFVEAYVKGKSLKPASLKKAFPYEGITGKMGLDADRDLVAEPAFAMVGPGGKRIRIARGVQ